MTDGEQETNKLEKSPMAPKVQPYQPLLDALNREHQKHLEDLKESYDRQLEKTTQALDEANKRANKYKADRNLLQDQVNESSRNVTRLRQELAKTRTWYKSPYFQVPAGLLLLALGALGTYELMPGKNAACTKCPGYESSIKALQNEKNALSAENDGYKTKLAQSDKLISNLTKNRADADELRKAGAISDTAIANLRKEVEKLNKEGTVSNTMIANLANDGKKTAEERDALAKEHAKCKNRVFVDLENRGDGLSQKLETMRPYLKRLAKEFGYDEYDMGEILVNIDINYDGKITKQEQTVVDFYFRKGYKYVFGVATKDGLQKASDVGIAAYTLNFADNDFPAYDDADVGTKSAIKSAKSEINAAKTRTVFSKTDFKNLCDKIPGVRTIIGDDGVTLSYNGNSILAYLNKPNAEIENWNYFDINKEIIYNIKFEGWGPNECLKALKDYLSSMAPRDKK